MKSTLRTIYTVLDNSGIKYVKGIGPLVGDGTTVGSTLRVSVKAIKNTVKASATNLTVGQMCKAVLIGTSKRLHRDDGTSIKWDNNIVALIKDSGEPVATRLNAPAPKELIKYRHYKILSLARAII